jgi:hypothetical protein
MVQGSGFRVQGSGFRVQGSGFRVQGSGFRVEGARVYREHPRANYSVWVRTLCARCLRFSENKCVAGNALFKTVFIKNFQWSLGTLRSPALGVLDESFEIAPSVDSRTGTQNA